MKRSSDARRGRRGTTLVELTIVLLLLGAVLGSMTLFGRANDRAYRTGITSAHLEEQAAATLDRVVLDLRTANVESFSPDPVEGTGASSFVYVLAEGLAGGDVIWSPLRRLALEYESGEVDDGLDNNGNGLVDEGRLVLTEDVLGPNERRRVLTRWVREHLAGEAPNGLDDNGNGLIDERGFVVERAGETLRIRLTLERVDAERRVMTRTSTTSIRPRN